MRRGWVKLEPNSYCDEYKHNRNSWGVIHLCIDKTIHYFLKLDLSPGLPSKKKNEAIEIMEVFASHRVHIQGKSSCNVFNYSFSNKCSLYLPRGTHY